MRKKFKELYDDFNVPINDNGGYLELGGFVIVILLFIAGLFLFNEFIHPITGLKQIF